MGGENIIVNFVKQKFLFRTDKGFCCPVRENP